MTLEVGCFKHNNFQLFGCFSWFWLVSGGPVVSGGCFGHCEVDNSLNVFALLFLTVSKRYWLLFVLGYRLAFVFLCGAYLQQHVCAFKQEEVQEEHSGVVPIGLLST